MLFWRIALVLVVVMVGLLVGGCRKFSTFFDRSHASYSHRASKSMPPGGSQDLGLSAVQTVTDYVTALREKDYAKAYSLLSRDSQSRHSHADFEQQGKQGMPLYDLESASATIKGSTARVEVGQIEDPATYGFHLVREDQAWKVIYRGGVPGMPYADD